MKIDQMLNRDFTQMERMASVALLAIVLHLLFGASKVGLSLWLFEGRAAQVVGLAYVGALLWAIVNPRTVAIQIVLSCLGVLFWLGRAGGFLELAAGGQHDLLPAAHERLTWSFLIVLHPVEAEDPGRIADPQPGVQ